MSNFSRLVIILHNTIKIQKHALFAILTLISSIDMVVIRSAKGVPHFAKHVSLSPVVSVA